MLVFLSEQVAESDRIACGCTRYFSDNAARPVRRMLGVCANLEHMAIWPCQALLAVDGTGVCMQRNTTGDDGLELWPDSASAANIGIMLFRRGAGKLAKVSLTYLSCHVH